MSGAQHSYSDCGYVCISTLLAHFKVPSPVHAIKALVGSTQRGLSIAQLHTAFQKVGAVSTAIASDRHRASAYPCPGVVLLKRGHYVALTNRRGNKFRVFDPSPSRPTRLMAELSHALENTSSEAVIASATDNLILGWVAVEKSRLRSLAALLQKAAAAWQSAVKMRRPAPAAFDIRCSHCLVPTGTPALIDRYHP